LALNRELGSLLTAVVRKIRSPQTTGLECPNPGIAVFHWIFSPVSTFQASGMFEPSATPEAR
jgi:hypothetical protein